MPRGLMAHMGRHEPSALPHKQPALSSISISTGTAPISASASEEYEAVLASAQAVAKERVLGVCKGDDAHKSRLVLADTNQRETHSEWIHPSS